MLALLMWSKNPGFNATEGASLDLRTWEWAGRFIIEAVSIGDETSINVIKTWRHILELLGSKDHVT